MVVGLYCPQVHPYKTPINWKAFHEKDILPDLTYYTPALHYGSFALPNHIKSGRRIALDDLASVLQDSLLDEEGDDDDDDDEDDEDEKEDRERSVPRGKKEKGGEKGEEKGEAKGEEKGEGNGATLAERAVPERVDDHAFDQPPGECHAQFIRSTKLYSVRQLHS